MCPSRHPDPPSIRLASTPGSPARGRAGRDRAPGGDDRGFALVWFALVLVVMLACAGAAVDVWNWWYNGTQNQRTADAAALAGVVFLPQDTTAARNTAMDVAVANGAVPAEVTIATATDDPTLAANELKVTVENVVGTRFLSLLGVNSARVGRDAVAEYTSRLPMGSPEQFLGRDPERGEDPGYWISVSGRAETKVGGDRYQNANCGAANVSICDLTPPVGEPQNSEYRNQGYAFSIEMSSAPTGPVQIEVYDPIHTETGSQDCTNAARLPGTGPTSYADPAIKADITARFPTDVQRDARYAPGDTIYCNGDIGGGNQDNSASANITTFIARTPDVTPADDFDNPPIDPTPNTPDTGCTRQFSGTDLRPTGTVRTIYELIAGREGPAIADRVGSMYRKWVTVCTVSQATATNWYNAGTRSIILQIRSNAQLNSPFTSSTASRQGRNHFAIRAYYGLPIGIGQPLPSSGLSVFAQGSLPIHNGAAGSSTVFYLTRVPPGNAGRTLSLEFFDVADAAQPAIFEIVPPVGFGGTFDDCTFTRYTGNGDGTDTGTDEAANAVGCKLFNVSNIRYNGRTTDVRVKVPGTYTCDVTDPLDCWIKVKVAYAVGTKVSDHTVWDAGVVGEPVRLIE